MIIYFLYIIHIIKKNWKQNILPTAKIYGCNFHFNQLLWREVQNIGLASSYKEDADILLQNVFCLSSYFNR